MANERFYTTDYAFTKTEIEEARKDDTIGNIKRKFSKSNKTSFTEIELYSSTESFEKDK